jgi:uncharacterized protein (DUF1800 family)
MARIAVAGTAGLILAACGGGGDEAVVAVDDGRGTAAAVREAPAAALTDSKIVLRARGVVAGNVGPVVSLRVDGLVVAKVEVRSTTMRDYTFTVPPIRPGAAIDVVFTNDAVVGGVDRTLYVGWFRADATTVYPTAKGVVYDRGAGSAAFDGKDVVAGTETLDKSGALRFALPVDEPVLVSAPAEFRFLSQATFGPAAASLNDLRRLGYEGWLQAQFAAPWRTLYAPVLADYREQLAKTPADARPRKPALLSAFWREALSSEAQLRFRVAYALSQIFVVSMESPGGEGLALSHASYFDALARNAFGNYRQLLETVALHPAMGVYLSHRGNMGPNPYTGRVPDENFAREVMQLFSIGLVQLNQDGTVKRDASGRPIPTYGPSDVTGLAHVFTGWSWDCGNLSADCFTRGFGVISDPLITTKPMMAFPSFHSKEEKRFLGAVVPAQSTPNPRASLKVALDTIANHPNVGPFIGRQLIQRLVTSNPSPSYVAAVAAVFINNGKGVRGDLGAVVRAILLHPEARQPGVGEGKVREPVLRLAALARAYGVKSRTGDYLSTLYEPDEATLGQIPLNAPSVFNFYRPGYAPSSGRIAEAGLVAPEMQITDESAVASHVNYMRKAVEVGIGPYKDMYLDLSPAIALADRPAALADHVINRLLGDGGDYALLRSKLVDAVTSIAVPWGGRPTPVANALRDRARLAVLLVVASPEFIVQR